MRRGWTVIDIVSHNTDRKHYLVFAFLSFVLGTNLIEKTNYDKLQHFQFVHHA